MLDYSLSVALFDFLPVLLCATALAFLAQGISRKHHAIAPLAWGAALLIPLGGLCKASWKLSVALGQAPTDWLENLLFIFMAPGFVIMAYSFSRAHRAWRLGISAPQAQFSGARLLLWIAVPAGGSLSLYLLSSETRLWFFWLLGITTLANASLLIQALLAARWSGLGWPTMAALVYNLLATFALGGLARLPDSEASAWIQEGLNFSAQAALAFGFWRLGRRMQDKI